MLSNTNNKPKTQITSFIIPQKNIQRLYMLVPAPGGGGQEMEVVEEYSLSKPYLLLYRKRLVKKRFAMGLGSSGSGMERGGESGKDWSVEVGDEHVTDDTTTQHGSLMIKPNASTPFTRRIDTATHFTFKIRNLPYDKSVYSISPSPDGTKLIVKTSNKKFYTQLEIRDVLDVGLKMDGGRVSWEYSDASSTLVIKYEKPRDFLKWEEWWREERMKLPDMASGTGFEKKAKGKETSNSTTTTTTTSRGGGQQAAAPPDCNQQ